MRILIATANPAPAGGIETYLAALLPALAQRDHELGLLHERPLPEAAAGIDAGACGGRVWLAAVDRRDETLERVRRWRPDLVFVNGLEGIDLEEALLRLAPGVLFAHGYHGSCISGTRRRMLPQVRPCDRRFGAACLALYMPCRCGGLNPLTLLRQFGVQRRRFRLLQRYRSVVVASTHMANEYRRHGIENDRVRLVPLFPPGHCRDPLPPPERPRTDRILLVGRLTAPKGGAFLVDAVRRSRELTGRDLCLVVAGDGPERVALEAQAARRGVPARFHGWLGAAACAALMRDADLLAVSSTWPEPFGLVGVEAGCVGLPAVGYAVGGIPDWLIPGETGELAPGNPPTVEGLAAAIMRALADPAHLQRLRAGAWRMAGRFTLQQHLDLLEPVLHEAAAAPGPTYSGTDHAHLAPSQR
jgi:glycosyltransferase involved in cell wall biosynthesis